MNLENATEVLLPLIESGVHDADELMTALANDGFKITRIPAFVTKVLENAGLRLSPAKRNLSVAEFMIENAPESFESWDSVVDLATEAADQIGSSTVGQIISAIKKWAKANGVELPEQTKPVTSVGSRTNKFDAFTDHYLANPKMTDDDIVAYCAANITRSGEANPKQAAKYVVAFGATARLARSFQ
tara:strand:+ start:4513 stop:5073 length:561 start_codon:yes stop_codon:yes gene_type:complete